MNLPKKPKKKSKIFDTVLEVFTQKIKDASIEDVFRLGLDVQLGIMSVTAFDNPMVWFLGPLALRLVQIPSNDNTSVNVGMMGASIELPNAQTVGLVILGAIGALNLMDSFKGVGVGSSSFDPRNIYPI